MPAYVIADIAVHDPQVYDEYRRRVPGVVAAFGGRFLAVGAGEPLEGTWRPATIAVIEFPTLEDGRRCFASPEYQALIPLRQASSTSSLVAVGGLRAH